MRRRCKVYVHCSHCPQHRREHCWGANGFPDNQQRGPIHHCLQETYHLRLLNAESMKVKGKRSRPQGLGISSISMLPLHTATSSHALKPHQGWFPGPRSPHSLGILMEQQRCDHTPGRHDDHVEGRGLPSSPNGWLEPHYAPIQCSFLLIQDRVLLQEISESPSLLTLYPLPVST